MCSVLLHLPHVRERIPDRPITSMSTITIRTAAATDTAAIARLIERAVRVSNAPDYPPDIIKLIVANFTAERVAQKMAERDVFVGLMSEAMIGTVSLGGGKLHSLFVEPDRQGQGIGRRLVEHLERHAIDRGLAKLDVSSSITARLFYEKLGYQLLTFEPRQNGSTFLMSKQLGP